MLASGSYIDKNRGKNTLFSFLYDQKRKREKRKCLIMFSFINAIYMHFYWDAKFNFVLFGAKMR